MDGVLVDVTRSYRETIRLVVRRFSGHDPDPDEIQALKNQGGWNDDWALSRHLIAQAGAEVSYGQVVDYFNRVFLGNGSEGMIRHERWIARPGLLERLARCYRLALFTGRSRPELAVTLRRFPQKAPFDPVIAAEDVVNPKPAPDGLLRIAALHPGRELWYVGDTVDDARSARAAGVPFIGIAAPGAGRHHELVALLRTEGALAVLPDINTLEEVLPK
jgi:HAD superfamily phosphatase